jgi:hypothetical protein
MLFDIKVGPSIEEGNVAGRKLEVRELMNATVKQKTN